MYMCAGTRGEGKRHNGGSFGYLEHLIEDVSRTFGNVLRGIFQRKFFFLHLIKEEVFGEKRRHTRVEALSYNKIALGKITLVAAVQALSCNKKLSGIRNVIMAELWPPFNPPYRRQGSLLLIVKIFKNKVFKFQMSYIYL